LTVILFGAHKNENWNKLQNPNNTETLEWGYSYSFALMIVGAIACFVACVVFRYIARKDGPLYSSLLSLEEVNSPA